MSNTVKVDVYIDAQCSLSNDEITSVTDFILENNFRTFSHGTASITKFSDQFKDDFIEIVTTVVGDQVVPYDNAKLIVNLIRLINAGPERDSVQTEDDSSVFEIWDLPNLHLHGLWESIIVDQAIKQQLLGYCHSSLQFAKANIDSKIISWNRMALLHGPPGTGKTTLCKALAQTSFIQHSEYYQHGMMIELRAHCLFSKYFAESGKMVMKLFDHILALLNQSSSSTTTTTTTTTNNNNNNNNNSNLFIYLLIDEIESITTARNISIQNNEPSDAIRAVNAVLTALDTIKRYPNVLILCTSNMLDSIDPAFKDRLDLQLYMGPPPVEARYQIMTSCLNELINKRLIIPASYNTADRYTRNKDTSIASTMVLRENKETDNDNDNDNDEDDDGNDDNRSYHTIDSNSNSYLTCTYNSKLKGDYNRNDPSETSSLSSINYDTSNFTIDEYTLLRKIIIHYTEGMSGRILRKLPLQTFATMYSNTSTTTITTTTHTSTTTHMNRVDRCTCSNKRQRKMTDIQKDSHEHNRMNNNYNSDQDYDNDYNDNSNIMSIHASYDDKDNGIQLIIFLYAMQQTIELLYPQYIHVIQKDDNNKNTVKSNIHVDSSVCTHTCMKESMGRNDNDIVPMIVTSISTSPMTATSTTTDPTLPPSITSNTATTNTTTTTAITTSTAATIVSSSSDDIISSPESNTIDSYSKQRHHNEDKNSNTNIKMLCNNIYVYDNLKNNCHEDIMALEIVDTKKEMYIDPSNRHDDITNVTHQNSIVGDHNKYDLNNFSIKTADTNGNQMIHIKGYEHSNASNIIALDTIVPPPPTTTTTITTTTTDIVVGSLMDIIHTHSTTTPPSVVAAAPVMLSSSTITTTDMNTTISDNTTPIMNCMTNLNTTNNTANNNTNTIISSSSSSSSNSNSNERKESKLQKQQCNNNKNNNNMVYLSPKFHEFKLNYTKQAPM